MVVMATVGMLMTACGFPDDAVAKVGDTYIELADFTELVDGYAAQYDVTQESDAESYKQILEYIGPFILEDLVMIELAAQKAPDYGLSVTEDELQNEILVYSDGDLAALEAGLKATGQTMDDVKEQVTGYLLYKKMRELITKDVPPASDEAVAAYYEKNKAEFFTEQTIEARHIVVAVGGRALSSTAAPDSTPTGQFTDIQWTQALATAAQARVELLEGASWTRVAARYSDDTATKGKGGYLGAVAQGSLVGVFGQEFEDALFSLELDQMSELVQTVNGYHIIQVTKIVEPRQLTFEEAKADIAALVTNQAERELWLAWVAQAKTEIPVSYRDEYRPTTTVAPTTTTAAPAAK